MGTAPDLRSVSLSTVDDLGEALVRLSRETFRVLRQETARCDLSMPQFLALRWLARDGPHPATEWARSWGGSPSAASELLDGLVTLGWAHRTTDPKDRRRVLLALTRTGARKVTTVQAAHRARVHSALGGLSPSEIERSRRVLATLVERIAAGPSRGIPARSRRPAASRGPTGVAARGLAHA